MKSQPLAVTLLEQKARRNARGLKSGLVSGRAEEDGVRCHYYPNSKTFVWWIFSRKCPKGSVIEHFRFQEAFRKQA